MGGATRSGLTNKTTCGLRRVNRRGAFPRSSRRISRARRYSGSEEFSANVRSLAPGTLGAAVPGRDLFQFVPDLLLRGSQFIALLQIEPKRGRRAEPFAEAQGRVHGDVPAARDDLADPVSRDIELTRELGGRYVQLVTEYFAGVYGCSAHVGMCSVVIDDLDVFRSIG